MKTRIISGIIIGIIVVSIIALGVFLNPFIITAFIMLIAAVGVYEILHNVSEIKSVFANAVSGIYSALAVFFITNGGSVDLFGHRFTTAYLSAVYILICVVVILKKHTDFTLAKIVSFCTMPIVLAYAFSNLGSIINVKNGIYYLLLLLNYSSICDMGAYFVGVTIGKHKLCPQISPKKTVEGAIGGIVSSLIVTVVLLFAFSMTEKFLLTVILTVPLCIIGMLGDLFASAIKRSVNLKDYGNLIPGHGGILDRMDSILLLAPFVYMCMNLGVI